MMYTKSQTIDLQDKTKALLSHTIAYAEKQIGDLRDVLRFHEYRYYILSDPLISDKEYDVLYKALEKLETDHPSLIVADSPTQRVAKGITASFPVVQHLVPMLSLENSYNAEDLRDFDRKARDLAGKDLIEYCVE